VERGTPLLDQMKRTAHDAIAKGSPDDRIWLVLADGTLRAGSVSALLDELDRVRPLSGAGNLSDAVARATSAVASSGLDARQVAVLTDGQRTAWQQPATLKGDVPVLAWAPSTAAPTNRAVVAADARPSRWTPRGAIAARVMSPDSTTYRMALGERTLARGTVAPNEEAIVRAAPAERGWTAGVLEIEPDELTADNVRHFALWIGPAPAVRVTPGAGSFAKSAIDVLRSTDRVVDGNGILVANADETSTLPALITPPTDAVRLGAANRALERLGIPWRYGAQRRETAVAHGDRLQSVAVTTRFELVPRGALEAETLAVVGREPWIVAGPKYVLLGSPLDPQATSLPVAADFLPWLADVIASRLHADPGGLRQVTPGARVTKPRGVEALESATGNAGRIALSGESFDAPTTSGTYFFVQGGRRVGALVVNAEVQESQLDRWSPADLAAHIATNNARVENDPNRWTQLAFTGAARRSLVVPLLALALLLLGAETVIAATGGRAAA
jgi:hypothetical protein